MRLRSRGTTVDSTAEFTRDCNVWRSPAISLIKPRGDPTPRSAIASWFAILRVTRKSRVQLPVVEFGRRAGGPGVLASTCRGSGGGREVVGRFSAGPWRVFGGCAGDRGIRAPWEIPGSSLRSLHEGRGRSGVAGRSQTLRARGRAGYARDHDARGVQLRSRSSRRGYPQKQAAARGGRGYLQLLVARVRVEREYFCS